jgi:hypothetical protein
MPFVVGVRRRHSASFASLPLARGVVRLGGRPRRDGVGDRHGVEPARADLRDDPEVLGRRITERPARRLAAPPVSRSSSVPVRARLGTSLERGVPRNDEGPALRALRGT